jgi:putative flippase GtrA
VGRVLKPATRSVAAASGARGPLAWLTDAVARLRGMLAVVVREVIKFGMVGAVAFVVDIAVFNLLLHVGEDPVLGDRPVTAKIVSAGVATVVAWLGNRYWTFRHRRRSAVPQEIALFFLINGIGMGLAAGCLAVSRYVLDLSSPLADNVSANGVGLVLGMVFRFLAYRYIVFRGDLEARRRSRTPTDPKAGPAPEPQRTWTTSPALSETTP